MEIVELPDHPWFLGCQFHPEFKSRPMAAHPLFREFIKARQEQPQEIGLLCKKSRSGRSAGAGRPFFMQ